MLLERIHLQELTHASWGLVDDLARLLDDERIRMRQREDLEYAARVPGAVLCTPLPPAPSWYDRFRALVRLANLEAEYLCKGKEGCDDLGMHFYGIAGNLLRGRLASIFTHANHTQVLACLGSPSHAANEGERAIHGTF